MARLIRVIARRSKGAAPVILDVAGFLAITVGAVLLWGAVAWIVAGVLLIISGIRAQS